LPATPSRSRAPIRSTRCDTNDPPAMIDRKGDEDVA
jgi:hypothetical protein